MATPITQRIAGVSVNRGELATLMVANLPLVSRGRSPWTATDAAARNAHHARMDAALMGWANADAAQ